MGVTGETFFHPVGHQEGGGILEMGLIGQRGVLDSVVWIEPRPYGSRPRVDIRNVKGEMGGILCCWRT